MMAQAHTLFHHLLVPTDGSRLSVTAGRLAVRLAAFHRAQLTFVYVVDTSVVEALADTPDRMAEHVEQELALSGQRYLDYLSNLAANVDLEANQVIRRGVPYREIERLAREQNVDLIVIGQVGQRGPRRILIGSVTERVIECAPCAVLVVK
jgi:nucleotide-binding universal stress UspA family protein